MKFSKTMLGVFLTSLFLQISPSQGQDSIATTVVESIPQEIQSVDLEAMPANQVEMTLQKLFPDVVFSADTVSNSLYFRASDKRAAEIKVFVAHADQRAAQLQMQKEANFQEMQLERLGAERARNERREKRETFVVRLKHLGAEAAQRVLQELQLDRELTVSASGQSLVLSGEDTDALDEVMKLITELDVPQAIQSSNLAQGDNIVPQPFVEGMKSDEEAIGFYSNLQRQRETGTRVRRAANSEQLPVTIQEQAKAFRAKQAYLRKQIELQREKLKMLERRLEERERLAERYFRAANVDPSLDTEIGALIGDATIEFVDETIIVRGKEQDVKRVFEIVEQIEEQARNSDASTSLEEVRTPLDRRPSKPESAEVSPVEEIVEESVDGPISESQLTEEGSVEETVETIELRR
ncbi:MAG: hypothetical protein AAFX06_04135 [Planctomycetota bacterium]